MTGETQAEEPNSGSVPDLLKELDMFTIDCQKRYRFNSRSDTAINISGIGVSVAIVLAGVLEMPKTSAVLGGVVGALVSAQRAFPFAQRANFYRNLVGQVQNLRTETRQALTSIKDSVKALGALRLDYAQQLPRGAASIPSHEA
jgi:hypothetical protein